MEMARADRRTERLKTAEASTVQRAEELKLQNRRIAQLEAESDKRDSRIVALTTHNVELQSARDRLQHEVATLQAEREVWKVRDGRTERDR